MEPINISIVDSPILEQTQFGDDMKNWLANSVDIINDTIRLVNGFFNNVLVVSTYNAGGMGAGPVAVPLLGLTPNGDVLVRLISSTNPVSITNVTPGTDQFTVTFSADPGASAIIAYQGYTQNPQG